MLAPRSTSPATAVDRTGGEPAPEARAFERTAPAAAARDTRDTREARQDREKRIYLEQVTLLYQQAFSAAFVNVVVAALVIYTYYGAVPRRALAEWASLVGGASAITSVILWRYHRATVTVETARLWGRLRLLETAITGSAWGSIALLIFPSASPTLQLSVMVVLAGLASGCIPINGARLEVYVAYVLPLCVPIAARLIFSDTQFRLVGLTGVPFLITVIVTAHRLAQRTESSLRLQFENWSLARELDYEVAERRRAEEKLELKSTIDQLSESLQQRNRELTIALRRAEEAAKVKSQFLANMSHELRTPLNAIINIPEGLLEDFVPADVVRCAACEGLFEPEPGDTIDASSTCPACDAVGRLELATRDVYAGDPARTRKHLGTIRQGGRHLLSLITDVLDFSKIEAGKVVLRAERVELRQLLADLRAALSPLAEPKRIALRMPDGAALADLTLEADPVKLVQIFTNLIGNAIKFSEEGSTVEMRVERREETYLMSVRDQGIGIHPKDHDLVFEAFRQVDGGDTRRFGGSGLGLTITRDLVQLHGGTIRLESAPGVGSTFFVELPRPAAARLGSRAEPRVKPIGKVPARRPAAEPLREVLLYVEDDDRNWEVAELRLQNHYNMVRARTAEEACDLINLHGSALAAILMDIQLQGSALDGIRLTQLLRGNLPRLGLPRKLATMPVLDDLPIIFVTAHAARYSEEELLAAGGDRALTKPVEFGQLMLLLASIYLKKRAR